MPLTAASSRADVLAEYANNASYDVDNDAVKCKAFIVACRYLLSPQFQVKRINHGGVSRGSGGEEAEVDQELIQAELARAIAWLSANNPTSSVSSLGGGGVVHLEKTGDFRD